MDWKNKLYFGDNLRSRAPTDFFDRDLHREIPSFTNLLAGKEIQFPEHRVETFAKAERKTKHEQEEMF
ncbi:MAG TPA: hypothetical protein VMW54_12010 [Terriglobia bacterium]|nr:hypothetical protein [Terriglobia bacterium]